MDVFDVAAERQRKDATKERIWQRKCTDATAELSAALDEALAEPNALAANAKLCAVESLIAARKLAGLKAQNGAVRAAAAAHFGTSERFTIIYADPPWRYKSTEHILGTKPRYPTMSLDELAALPVAGLADDDAVLVMWATFHMLDAAIALFPAWGFELLTVFCVWVKVDRAGNPLYSEGMYTMPCAEFALFGVRGTLHITQHTEIINSVVRARPRGHSRKPPIVRDMIVRLFGDFPRIELFARCAPPDWVAWGNQATRFANDLVPDYAETAGDGFLPRELNRKRLRSDRSYRIDRAGGAETFAGVTSGTMFGRLHAEYDAETQTPQAWRRAAEDHDHDGTLPCCRPASDQVSDAELRNTTMIRAYIGTGGYEAVRNTLYNRTTEATVRERAADIRQQQRHNADMLWALNNNRPPRPFVRVAPPSERR